MDGQTTRLLELLGAAKNTTVEFGATFTQAVHVNTNTLPDIFFFLLLVTFFYSEKYPLNYLIIV